MNIDFRILTLEIHQFEVYLSASIISSSDAGVSEAGVIMSNLFLVCGDSKVYSDIKIL
jgi:hypothetical protein